MDVEAIRSRFPALSSATVFLDGPAGTQVPDTVIAAVADRMRRSGSNVHGMFPESRESEDTVLAAREAAARFLGCAPDDVGFGPSTTSLNFALTRALGPGLRAGDHVVTTQLDHDANVAPWIVLARDLGLELTQVPFHPVTGKLDLDEIAAAVRPRTRVIACPWASNALGTITDVAAVAGIAHEADALSWIDAVHYAPHHPIDVAAAGADVLVCSAYKFYGPHVALAYVSPRAAGRLEAYRVRPVPARPVAQAVESGTPSFAMLAGLTAALEYVERLDWSAVEGHERALGERFLTRLPEPFAVLGPPAMDGRTPTFSVAHPQVTPAALAEGLGKAGFAVWAGDFYAVEVMRRLGRPDGTLRIGFVHYNTLDEADGVVAALAVLGR